MATQGLVTVVSNKKVFMKVVVGCEGYNARKVASRLKKDWPVSADKAHEIASKAQFGCEECRVVITRSKIVIKGDHSVSPLYRKTFQKPKFNPRWNRGTAYHTVVIKV